MSDTLQTFTPEEYVQRFAWGNKKNLRRTSVRVANSLLLWADRRLTRMVDVAHSSPHVSIGYEIDTRTHVAYISYNYVALPAGHGRVMFPATKGITWTDVPGQAGATQ